MPDVQPSLLTRDDTFFGVCQGLGEDLGFNPDLLRIALPILLFFHPAVAIGGYAAAGMIVFASRMLVREPRRTVTQAPVTAAEDERLPLAA